MNKQNKKITLLYVILTIVTVTILCNAAVFAGETGSLSENTTAKKVPGTDSTYYYTGKAVCPSVTLEMYLDGKWQEFDSKYYDLTYHNNINPSTAGNKAWVLATLKGNYSGTLKFYYTITDYYEDGMDFSKLSIGSATLYYNPLEKSSEGYDYMADVKNQLTVTTEDGTVLTENKDYDLYVYNKNKYQRTFYVKASEDFKKRPDELDGYTIKILPHEGTHFNPRGSLEKTKGNAIRWATRAVDSITIEGLSDSEEDSVADYIIQQGKKGRMIKTADLPANSIVLKDSSSNVLEDAYWKISGFDAISDNNGLNATFNIMQDYTVNYYYSFSKDCAYTFSHSWNSGEVTAPTCSARGYTKYTCQKCGHTKTSDYTEATGLHDFEITEAKAPTCTSAGRTAGKKCRNCGYEPEKSERIPAEGHKYKDEVHKPTCMDDGYTVHTCEKCGYSYTDGWTSPLEHDWSEWEIETPATCIQEGFEKRTCKNPDANGEYHSERQSIGYGDHKPVPYEEVEPTDTTPGYTGGTYCSECGIELTPRTIVTHKHNWVTDRQDPTCENDGWIQRHCTICHENEEPTIIPALGHDLSIVISETPATCEEWGHYHKKCSRCDYEEEGDTEPLGHDFVNGKCTRCGKEDDRKDHGGSSSSPEMDIDITSSSSSSSNPDSDTPTVNTDTSEYDANDAAKVEKVISDAFEKTKQLKFSAMYAGKKTVLANFKFAGAAIGQNIPGTNIQFSKVKYKNNKKIGTAQLYITLKAGGSATKAEKTAVKNLNKKLKNQPINFEIVPCDLSKCRISGTATYTSKNGSWKFKLKADLGNGIKPFDIKYNKNSAKSDFTVDTAFDGSAQEVKITGRGNFTGEATISVMKK